MFCDLYLLKSLCHNLYTSVWLEKKYVSIQYRLEYLESVKPQILGVFSMHVVESTDRNGDGVDILMHVVIGYCLSFSFGYSGSMPVWILPLLSKSRGTGS